ncbi:MAG: hypothetical protein K2G55_03710 [Lachnospiraceae bacterium]|nr:hypothetical protein [Lachnospiraceae bacterium]
MYNKGKSVDVRQYLEYKNFKDRIIYKLINTEKYTELLEDLPHMEFLDLSIVFHCLISQKETESETLLVHNIHLKLWDVTVEELFKAAKENTPKLLPYELKSMAEVICEDNPEEELDAENAENAPMYVLSNTIRVAGATCMLYTNLIRDIAELLGSSFYIIPSSVHEVLILPSADTSENEEIKVMIREINDTQMQSEEILSYSLYRYDKEEGRLYIC